MADEFGEVNGVPNIAAELRVYIGHGPKPPIECLNVFVDRTAALAHAFGDCSTSCQQIFNVMIKCSDQQALLVRSSLARRDIDRKALENLPVLDAIKFTLCGFLEPDLAAVALLELEGNDIGGAFGGHASDKRLEPLSAPPGVFAKETGSA